MRSAQNLCFVVNRFYALFRLNGSSKPSLTSKPLLTIALKILKTIEKPLVPMVGPPKKHSMVMVQLCQNHWKTIDGNGGLKKTLTIPSPWKIDHRCGLAWAQLFSTLIPDIAFITSKKKIYFSGLELWSKRILLTWKTEDTVQHPSLVWQPHICSLQMTWARGRPTNILINDK